MAGGTMLLKMLVRMETTKANKAVAQLWSLQAITIPMMKYSRLAFLYSEQRLISDQKETDRLDIMHKLTEVSLGGKLNLAPIPANAQRILDIGTGTGIWAIETGKKDCLLHREALWGPS